MHRIVAVPATVLVLSLSVQPSGAALAPPMPGARPVAAAGISGAIEVALIKDFADRMIDILKRKPETINCKPIRGRPPTHEACRMV